MFTILSTHALTLKLFFVLLQHYYYKPSDDKNHQRGILHDKNINSIAARRRSVHAEPSSKRKKKHHVELENKNLASDEGMVNVKLWLANNDEPWSEVLAKQHVTFEYIRKYLRTKDKTIRSILTEWPRYLFSMGHILVTNF